MLKGEIETDTSNKEHKEGYVKWFAAYIDKHTKPFTVTLIYNREDEEEKAECWVLNRGMPSITSTKNG